MQWIIVFKCSQLLIFVFNTRTGKSKIKYNIYFLRRTELIIENGNKKIRGDGQIKI